LHYISTRADRLEQGSAATPIMNFEDALLAGLARDGGLYVPEHWPKLVTRLSDVARMPYARAAEAVLTPFIDGEIESADVRELLDAAYASFSHDAIAPLVQIGPDHWLMELFHGPTLAFKDVAMQVLGRTMDRTLQRRGSRATVIGATSGDTGGAAIEAFRGRDTIDIFVLHPHGRTSAVQRKQMTSAVEANVHNIAIEGSFDDCQAIVKALFSDLPFRDRLHLAGVNSINWARILAQVVYYVTATAALSGDSGRPVSFSVPTGNFGDIFAGWVARRMGVPIGRLIIATNENDILARTVATGMYRPQGVRTTQSPSMDIQVSSNFERLLFELTGRDAGRLRAHMNGLRQGSGFTLSAVELDALRADFDAERVNEAETTQTMRALYRRTGQILDPHTAIGIAAAERRLTSLQGPVVTLATAHPAKFPDAVKHAIGFEPAIPTRLAAQMAAPERFTILPNNTSTVAAFIDERAKLGRVHAAS
jgi:threonine synthase